MSLTAPYFFQYIENRDGYQVNDILLANITPRNVSIPLFLTQWSMALLIIMRTVKRPDIFLTCLYGFLVMNVLRLTTILIVPLNPPEGLIPLIDPLSNAFYGKGFVTKDLFFSGHTGSQFLILLCLDKKRDKMISIVATTMVAAFVLIQHVHYTLDVVMAPFFAYISYRAGKKLALE